ncbi:MAG TPA: hypothetical protein VK990_01125 [Acidimicrobiia bacterium]|nr:hypothetical protein [Acidimicrobiia bacterium]
MRRNFRIVTITAVLVMVGSATALAGAIPVVTFDEVPTEFGAGTTHTLSFSILSHGEAVDAGPTSVRFHGPDGETLTFDARYDGAGRYTVEVTLPTSGQWQWAVASSDYIRQELGTISVTPAAGMPGLLASLRIGLPIATLLALILLIVQLPPRKTLERRPMPVTDVG